MREFILNEYNLTLEALELAQMRAELVCIGEKERILRERSADLEAFRYLLDAHRVIASARLVGEQMLSISPQKPDKDGQLAA
ncbi:hypothetical protein SAMN05216330_103733 [Bradyrhizobium sp. Ghvi]|uniref:hypothetical protein n=1 Tax=Bradyrhizobium sp. Ghvi TaxID=1855319 RepID=UPI0008EE26F3|nr:hypothetical protein [Bradyrhizobium sp. Ghvi]SFO58202.1 hypothetical protein SAMN05216330_103733 [Bradyrhizobium sp. Ghvi]